MTAQMALSIQEVQEGDSAGGDIDQTGTCQGREVSTTSPPSEEEIGAKFLSLCEHEYRVIVIRISLLAGYHWSISAWPISARLMARSPE